jgi:hypothetical protein
MAERSTAGGASIGFPAILNGILIVLTLAGGVWLVSDRLESARPPTPPGQAAPAIGDQAFDARLWEDPFSPTGATGATAGLDLLREQIKQAGEEGEVVLLPVMIPGGPYSEDRESRIRSRFAVVSALGRQGYVPVDAEHLGIVKLCWPTSRGLRQVKKRASWKNEPPVHDRCKGNDQVVLSLRYEWYRPRVFFPGSDELRQGGVLVLWIDDDDFADEPLLRLPLLFEPLVAAAGPYPHLVVRLIGPSRSSTLRAMLPNEFRAPGASDHDDPSPDLKRAARLVLDRVALYSATASAMDEVLVHGVLPLEPRSIVKDKLTAAGFHEVHFLNASDADTASEIVEELALRDVDLRNLKNHLVLLYEWDTFYGRMLTLTYGVATSGKVAHADLFKRASFIDDYRQGKQGLPTNLHVYSYLRGLDGRTLGETKAAEVAPGNNTVGARARPGTLEEILRWSPGENATTGRAQLDYLYRLGDQLQSLHDQLRLEGDRGIKAVGIVGSDVYDVLLILQALRPRFPDVLFFATDVDVRMWDANELKWSRNLIVSSSYGLSLNKNLQGEVPPFRDSTQTAQFAAVLAALGDPCLSRLDYVPPRRFEIGNGTPVDLSVPERLRERQFNRGGESVSRWLHPPPRGDAPPPSSGTDPRQCFGLPMPAWTVPSATTLQAARTSRAERLVAVFGMGLALLGYYWWSPIRPRHKEDFGYLSEPLRFTDVDVGGTAVANSTLQVAFSSEDSLCHWLAEQLSDRDPDLFPRPAVKRQNVLASASTDPKKLDTRANAFVSILNRMLTYELPIPKPVLATSGLVDSFHAAMDRPWNAPASWFNGPKRLVQRFLARRLLNHLLDSLGSEVPALATSGPTVEDDVRVAADARRAAMKLLAGRVWLVLLVGGSILAFFGILALAGHDAWDDTFFRPEGEPFSLTAGTSAWPNLLLRLTVPAVAWIFVILLVKNLRTLSLSLTRNYRLPISSSANVAPEHVSAAVLWQEFVGGGHVVKRAFRIAIPFVLYFVMGTMLLELSGYPVPPLRGSTAQSWSVTIRPWFYLVFLALSFLTIDAALRCRRFINALAAAPTEYPATTLAFFKGQRGDVSPQYLDEWIDTQLIADLTEGVGALLWFPGIVFLLMLAALNQWTDNWTAPNGLVIILCLNFLLSIASIVILQRAAVRAKEQAEESLYAKVKRAQAIAAPSPQSNDAAQAEKLLDEIRNLRRGAFRGFWENPVVGAILLPSGGTAFLQLVMWLAGR